MDSKIEKPFGDIASDAHIIVQFSGGIGSWASAKRLANIYGSEHIVLLFADTKIEDEDLYRFIKDATKNIGKESYTRIADGRDVWEVFEDNRFIGNSRIDPCSRILKRDLLRDYLDENFDHTRDYIALGIDWTEEHRLENAAQRWKPWYVDAPLCYRPYLDKEDILNWAKDEGLTVPRLYGMGFPHNNCGGFCVKAGQAHFKLLYETMPERFMYHAKKEQEMREMLDKDVSILTRQRNGKKYNLTLYQLAAEIDRGEEIDMEEWGGCGCAID